MKPGIGASLKIIRENPETKLHSFTGLNIAALDTGPIR